ncbi:MAG: cyclic nucleotide-binding domain-containing protein [Paracoccaceae bacterium]
MEQCIRNINASRGTPALASAPEPVVEGLLERATILKHVRGATIFSQDDPADAIYIVLDGWVKLFRIASSGTEAVVGVFTRGHSFGEAVALRKARYPVFAEAVTDGTLMRLDARELLKRTRLPRWPSRCSPQPMPTCTISSPRSSS